jgi:threonine/homoserine/homoserine lactone efflux protein
MPYSMLLCAIEIAVALTWLSGLAWLAQHAIAWLHRSVVDRWLQRALGVSLIAIGTAVATER